MLLGVFVVQATNYNAQPFTGTYCNSGYQSPVDVDDNDEVDDSDDYKLATSMTGAAAGSVIIDTTSDVNRYQFSVTNGASFGSITAYQPILSAAQDKPVGGTTYSCDSGEVHMPSEHQKDGDTMDVELQIYCDAVVSTDSAAGYSDDLVLAFLFDEGEESDFFTKLINNNQLDFSDIDAIDGNYIENYWTYVGSYTSGNCNLNKLWVIATEEHDIADF
jgi:carbonic anhydrase